MDKVKTEPVMAVALAIAAVLAILGVAIDANTVFVVLSAVVPLIGGVIQRSRVTPVTASKEPVRVETVSKPDA